MHPITRLSKENAAVLLVDHQTGLFSLVRDSIPPTFKNSVLAVADIAKHYELPTVLTTSIEKGPNGPIWPEIRERLPKAAYVERPGQINAWDCDEFVKAVKATGKKQLIIAGIVTEVCVAFPTLSALAEGYEVYVVLDACGTFSCVTREAAMMRMLHCGAVITTWFSLVSELHRDWRTDGEGLAKICHDHLPEYAAVMDEFKAK